MAYMRGENYIWSDGDLLHIWAADGYDGWDESGWHKDEEGEIEPTHIRQGEVIASGVSVSQEVMDEYVLMRLAQLIYTGEFEECLNRIITSEQNVGGLMIQKNATVIYEALKDLALEPTPPYDWTKTE